MLVKLVTLIDCIKIYMSYGHWSPFLHLIGGLHVTDEPSDCEVS